jgi:hypothetical protein
LASGGVARAANGAASASLSKIIACTRGFMEMDRKGETCRKIRLKNGQIQF